MTPTATLVRTSETMLGAASSLFQSRRFRRVVRSPPPHVIGFAGLAALRPGVTYTATSHATLPWRGVRNPHPSAVDGAQCSRRRREQPVRWLPPEGGTNPTLCNYCSHTPAQQQRQRKNLRQGFSERRQLKDVWQLGIRAFALLRDPKFCAASASSVRRTTAKSVSNTARIKLHPLPLGMRGHAGIGTARGSS